MNIIPNENVHRNLNLSCEGCAYMEREPWGKNRVAYRCMNEEQGHYGRVLDTQLPNALPNIRRPVWCGKDERTVTA